VPFLFCDHLRPTGFGDGGASATSGSLSRSE
jgi:hypothetical protein